MENNTKLLIREFYKVTSEYQQKALLYQIENCRACVKILLWHMKNLLNYHKHGFIFSNTAEEELVKAPVKFFEILHEELHLFKGSN